MDPGSRPAGIATNNALPAVTRNVPNDKWCGFSDQIIMYFADGLNTLPMRMQFSGATFALHFEKPYFSIDNAHLMYNAHPKLFRHSF